MLFILIILPNRVDQSSDFFSFNLDRIEHYQSLLTLRKGVSDAVFYQNEFQLQVS